MESWPVIWFVPPISRMMEDNDVPPVLGIWINAHFSELFISKLKLLFYRSTESEYFARFNLPPRAVANALSSLCSLLTISAEVGVLSALEPFNLAYSDALYFSSSVSPIVFEATVV